MVKNPAPAQAFEYLVAVQGFGRPGAHGGLQYERNFLSGSSAKSFTPDTAVKSRGSKWMIFIICHRFTSGLGMATELPCVRHYA